MKDLKSNKSLHIHLGKCISAQSRLFFSVHFFVHYYPKDKENMKPRQFNNCCTAYPYCKARMRKQEPKSLLKRQSFSSLSERQGILLVPPNHELTLILSFTSSMMLPSDVSFVQQTNCCMQPRDRNPLRTFGSK